jgi:hypothetical protein
VIITGPASLTSTETYRVRPLRPLSGVSRSYPQYDSSRRTWRSTDFESATGRVEWERSAEQRPDTGNQNDGMSTYN